MARGGGGQSARGRPLFRGAAVVGRQCAFPLLGRPSTRSVAWPVAALASLLPPLLAAGGITLSTTVGNRPQPALLVLQGRDEKLMQRFGKVALTLLEQELARQESNEHVEKGDYRGIPTARLRKDVHLAIAGSALLV